MIIYYHTISSFHRVMTSLAMIQEWIKMSSSFDSLVNKIETNSQRAVTGVTELKKRGMKEKGDLWEAFCFLYLTATNAGGKVYRGVDAPAESKLPKIDLGIDLVLIKADGNKIAVQCKYRHKRVPTAWRKKTLVTYKDLSTFLTLCAATGPWSQRLVMTNCDGVSWRGHKVSAMDKVLAIGTFQSIGMDTWKMMGGSVGSASGVAVDPPAFVLKDTITIPTLVDTTNEEIKRPSLTLQELRAARVARFAVKS